MASNLRPAYAYTVVYVKDVTKSLDFYAKAFGYNVHRLDDSHRWGELESGQTTIAFTPHHQHETDDLSGNVSVPHTGRERAPVEVCFAYTDVDAAFKVHFFDLFVKYFIFIVSEFYADDVIDRQRAVDNGAVAVSEPEDKEWGQRVGYVRDLDGIVVRMGSYVHPPKED